MELTGVSTLGKQSPSLTSATGSLPEANRDTFLRLLVAQLEHQDPLAPTSNTEFVAQLAQFSTLEQVEALNAKFEGLIQEQALGTRVQAAGFIGKEALAQGNAIRLQDGNVSPLQYRLGADSAQVAITIYNDAGALVHTIQLGKQEAGEQSAKWNGKTAQGNTLPNGNYTFKVSAADKSGNALPAETFVRGTVQSVEFQGSQALVNISGNLLPLSSLVRVSQLAQS